MTFQVDVRINKIGHIVEIEGLGISVNFDPKNYRNTMNALVDSCKELQPDLASDKEAIAYLTRSIQIQLTEIYKDYEQEKESKPKKGEDNDKRRYPVYKYSTKGKGNLHEAVMLAGLPIFLKYENEEIVVVETIEEAGRILASPNLEEYPYEPYEFSSMEEVRDILEIAKTISMDSLYLWAKQYVNEYNDQDDYKIKLVALDVIFSYFQDKFSTTHYVGIVGDNDSGKSSLGTTVEATGYRPVYMIDPSAPNIFRCIGQIEPGQCTIILDEADKIDKSPEMMAILKTGYQLTGKVPKINTNTYRQEFFFTYGLKFIIGEKSMNNTIAKGVLDRTFTFTAHPGDPPFDIKETCNHQANASCKGRFNNILSFRKLLLIYRLMHYNDPVEDIETGLRRRNRELVKPLLQLFYQVQPQVMGEITSILEHFLKDKQRKKETTLEAALCPIINRLVSECGIEIPASQIWATITGNNGIVGSPDMTRPDKFHTEDFGTIYRNTITNIICDKFGAKKRHTDKGSVLTFDLEKLEKLTKSYESEIKIQVKLIEQNPDGYDGSDGFSKALLIPTENQNVEIANNQSNLTNISEKNHKNNVNNATEKIQGSSDVPVKPSDPSDPSANLDNDENKGIDKKQDKEIHGMGATNKPESPSSTKASPPSPQFECPYCGQSFASQSELIAHMDKESEDARISLGK